MNGVDTAYARARRESGSGEWRRRKLLGYIVVWVYWTSFAWLPAPFRVFGIEPSDHPWLSTLLGLHYKPFMVMLPHMAPLLAPLVGWSMGLIWFAPVIAILVGGTCCSGLWWIVTRVIVRSRLASGGPGVLGAG